MSSETSRAITHRTDDGLTLVGDEWGPPDGPPVLMLHGAGQNRYAWKGTAARLAAEGWMAVTIDARGHGDSDWSPDGHYGFEYVGADVRSLLGRYDRRPAVIGASMGGMAALAAQESHGPGRLFEAVVLVDIAPNFDAAGATRIVRWMTAHPDGFATLEDASDAMAAYNPHRPRPTDLSGLTKVLRQGDDGRWRWRWDPAYLGSRPGFAEGVEPELTQEHFDAVSEMMFAGARLVDAPLLLVRGGRSDLVTPESAEAFLAAVPGTEYVDVAGTGHMVAGDDNDAFTGAVVEFLGRAAGQRGATRS